MLGTPPTPDLTAIKVCRGNRVRTGTALGARSAGVGAWVDRPSALILAPFQRPQPGSRTSGACAVCAHHIDRSVSPVATGHVYCGDSPCTKFGVTFRTSLLAAALATLAACGPAAPPPGAAPAAGSGRDRNAAAAVRAVYRTAGPHGRLPRGRGPPAGERHRAKASVRGRQHGQRPGRRCTRSTRRRTGPPRSAPRRNSSAPRPTAEVARLKAERFAPLARSGAVPKQDNDDVQATYQQALANVDAARAALETARIDLRLHARPGAHRRRDQRVLHHRGRAGHRRPAAAPGAGDAAGPDLRRHPASDRRDAAAAAGIRGRPPGAQPVRTAPASSCCWKTAASTPSPGELAILGRDGGSGHRLGEPARRVPESGPSPAAGHVRARPPARRRGTGRAAGAAAGRDARRRRPRQRAGGRRRQQAAKCGASRRAAPPATPGWSARVWPSATGWWSADRCACRRACRCKPVPADAHARGPGRAGRPPPREGRQTWLISSSTGPSSHG